MSDPNDDLDKFLDIASNGLDGPIMLAPLEGEIVIDPEVDNTIAEDFLIARRTVSQILGHGNVAIADLVAIATSSQNSKDYEALATLMNSIVAASKTLMEIQEKKVKLTPITNPKGPAGTINNNLFIGSTAELQKLLSSISPKR